ncbi:MAG: ATPase, T2SS/T4P/T4SS family, partial [Candidatus Wildermuthbacteria bacterium]|nr:ATPase, T2SS/T4P/T4SS family [Candidatus Wildermuthbacteria bacterium]
MTEVSKKITGQIEIPLLNVEKIKDVFAFKKEFESALGGEVTDLLNIVFGGAILLDASDVHLEPAEKKVKIRLRIDGALQDVVYFDPKTYETLLSRIKLLSGVKLNISDRPQDGRFSILIGGNSIEVRVSSLPAEYGESLVLRILNPKGLISFENLRLRKDLLEVFEKEIEKPNGMIIVTGPTGSGKTTTLYAFLKKIQNPNIKIITIEDPIE